LKSTTHLSGHRHPTKGSPVEGAVVGGETAAGAVTEAAAPELRTRGIKIPYMFFSIVALE
jgi:hypothetical protein